ncbi:phosphatidylinositol transfer protein domain containing protein [Babesia bovis T2Bo]|uniref:Phosphatidylinositol transfer protein domain containing protein n=1 Tax=Babesia bovis TaxID=5865 RepID=A7AWR0_BABBO|nr:phosphatidylinositol transfer protein domain containing protein [Babesia bovis T2Bo]EDO05488.1 phosphatidylinositol transfer protein domain containing protein [Babesia bovis T2Bo]|eukprot:XP_001609056.1 phosphatidylinositol transfer protein domain containing protein [Babesia bovis T2Bo]
MKIIEFRIPLPISLEMFQRCSLYLVTEASIKEVESGSAFEVMTNEHYERDGNVGRHTEKCYHFGKNLPSWLQALLGKDLTMVFEESWATYPYIFTKYSNKKLTSFEFSFESMNYEGLDEHENALNLSAKDLSRRKVVVLDLTEFKKCKLYDPAFDVTLAKSQYTDVLPMHRGWRKRPGSTGMVSYKVLKVDIPFFGFLSSAVENYLVNYLQDRMMAYLSHAMASIDEWHNANMDQLRIKEEECYELLNRRFREQRGSQSHYKKKEPMALPSPKPTLNTATPSDSSDEHVTMLPKRNSWDISDSWRDHATVASTQSGIESATQMKLDADSQVPEIDLSAKPTIERRWSTGSKSDLGSIRRLSISQVADLSNEDGEFWDCIEDFDEYDTVYDGSTDNDSDEIVAEPIVEHETASSSASKPLDGPACDSVTSTEIGESTNDVPIVNESEAVGMFDDSTDLGQGASLPYSPDPIEHNTDDSSDSQGDYTRLSPENMDMYPELVTSGGNKAPLTFTGYLYKLGGTIFYQWNVRYIVMREGTMSYYDKCGDQQPKFIIELADARVTWVGEYMRRQNVFSLMTKSKRMFYWCADTEQTSKRWTLLLQVLSEKSPEMLIGDLSTERIYRISKLEDSTDKSPSAASETLM